MHAHPLEKIKVNNASADQQVEREREMCRERERSKPFLQM